MSMTEAERADFASLVSGQISDAMEMLNFKRSVITGFLLLGPTNSKIIGPAVTVRQLPKYGPEPKEKPLMRTTEVSYQLAGKGDVVVVDVGGRTDVCSWGE